MTPGAFLASWGTMTIRAYTPADFATVEQWAKARNMALVSQLLSPNGFIVEDEEGPLAAAWCYITFDCPRASIDDFYGRPGADGIQLLKAWRILESAIFSFLRNLEHCQGQRVRYAVVISFIDERLAESLKGLGWFVSQKQFTQIIKPITYESS